MHEVASHLNSHELFETNSPVLRRWLRDTKADALSSIVVHLADAEHVRGRGE